MAPDRHQDQPTNPEILQLLAAVATGDQPAFKKLVDIYSDRLGRFIAAITKDQGLAEEIVQDVFLKIWQSRQTLTTVKNFHGWLFVIARHRALNALRNALIVQYDLQVPLFQLPTADDSLEQLQEKERRFSLLDAAVQSLPGQQKKAYLLSRRAGKSYKQIAEEMQLSPETVKKYLQLATGHIIKYIEAGATLTFFAFFIK
jgi:RNA polymerase sigma-70 factor (ECF subfamily)